MDDAGALRPDGSQRVGWSNARYFMRDAMPNIDFVAARIGSEAHSLRNWARQARVAESPPAERLWVRLARGTKRAPARVARKLLTNLSNGDLAALRVGRF